MVRRPAAAAAVIQEPDLEDEPDPVWAAILSAPVREETPEERAAFDAAVAAGSELIDGAEVTAEIARRRNEWPGDAGK